MATNTSKGITYPTSGDSIAPLETVFATLANTTNTALGAINASTDITAGVLPVARGGTGGAAIGNAAGKNKILNGDFGIWQRIFTAGTSTTSGGYYADRFAYNGPSGFTQRRQTFTPGSAPATGYEGKYYYNLTLTASNQGYDFLQHVEDVRTLAGQRVTLSFWARSTAGAQLCNSGIYQYYSAGDIVSAVAVPGQTYDWTATSSWQRFTFTMDLPNTVGKTITDLSKLWVRIFRLSQTTTNTSIDIWGVQLEAGSMATDFITATGNFAAELAACERYYQMFSSASGNIGAGFARTATSASIHIPHKSTMRTAPTVASQVSNTTMKITTPGGTAITVTGVSTSNLGTSGSSVIANIAASSLTVGQGSMLYITGDDYISLSAEL